MTVCPSVLDDATLEQMRAEAAADTSPFIDPAVWRESTRVLPGVDNAWLSRVTGRRVTGYRHLSPAELALAVKAAKADAAHLQALAGARRAEQQAAAEHAAETAATAAHLATATWQALRARLPVPVAVRHNWTARHLDGYEQGADHIVVTQDLHSGRLHRRAGRSLCWTPSRDRELRHVSANVGDDRRVPDCKACLRHADNLAARNRETS